MKKFWIVFIVIALVIGGGFGLLWHSLSSLEESVTIDGGVLVWDVGGQYAEERDDSFVGQVRNDWQLTLGETVRALYRAADDDRISAMVLNFRGIKTDWAKIEELRHAVAAFRDKGKKVVAYLDGAGTRDFALAVAADEIVISPEANIMVLGITAELSFMKDTLNKLGMKADFIHVGKFKSAPERMTRTEASDSNREMINSIVEDRYQALLEMLSSSRNVSKEEAARWVDIGMFDAQTASANGLIDGTMYYEEMINKYFADEDITYLSEYSFEKKSPKGSSLTVAVVYITGVIMPGESHFSNFQGKIAGSETVIEHLQSVGDDDNVDAVILRVDSPGGSALASDLIWREIRQVQNNKPVVVSMSGMAASGGYYVACLGDSIFADPGTLTGSIGVYAGKMDRSQMYSKIGVNREFVTRGNNALLFTDEGGFSAAQRELFQGQMEKFYERFLDKVASGRDMTRDEVHAIAQGRVWTGSQGMENGLVDGIGGFHRAIKSTKWMLGLADTDEVSVVTFGEELSLFERMLLKSMRDSGGFAKIATSLVDQTPAMLGVSEIAWPGLIEALREDGTLATVSLLDGRPVAMMPFWIRVQ